MRSRRGKRSTSGSGTFEVFEVEGVGMSGDDAGRLAIDQCAIRRSREWIQICAGDITRTAVFGAQVKPVTVGKALIAKAIAVVIEGVAALLDRLRADAGPAFGAITETRASATTEFIFVRTRLADRKPVIDGPIAVIIDPVTSLRSGFWRITTGPAHTRLASLLAEATALKALRRSYARPRLSSLVF